MLTNASYFAFTATPRTRRWRSSASRTRGGRQGQAPALPQLHDEAGDPGRLHPRRAARTTRRSTATTGWSRTIEDDPEFDTKRAQKKLRRYVESHDHAIRLKAEIMVDHFHEQVIGAEQDRRPGAGDGGDERHRAGDPVLPRDPRLPRGAQEPVPGDRRLLRRARVRRREGDRGVAQRLPERARSPTRSRRTRTAS